MENTKYLYRGKMIHGNKKYNFEDLKHKDDAIEVDSANVYSLKSSLRLFAKDNKLGKSKDLFKVEDISAKRFLVTRIS